MAFLGYVESVSNLHSAELQSKWLSHLLDEKFKLPGVEDMLEQTTKEIEVMKKTTRFYKRHCISVFSISHDDEICRDMGWKVLRKKNWLAEAFSPYTSQDYEKEDWCDSELVIVKFVSCLWRIVSICFSYVLVQNKEKHHGKCCIKLVFCMYLLQIWIKSIWVLELYETNLRIADYVIEEPNTVYIWSHGNEKQQEIGKDKLSTYLR